MDVILQCSKYESRPLGRLILLVVDSADTGGTDVVEWRDTRKRWNVIRAVEITIKRLAEGRYSVERAGEPGEMTESQVRLYLQNRVPHILPEVIIRQLEDKGLATVCFNSPV